MKKIFTLIGVALVAMSVNAQDKYVATVVTPTLQDDGTTKDVITLAKEFTDVIGENGVATNVVDGKSIVKISTANVEVEAVGGAVPANVSGGAQDITAGAHIDGFTTQKGEAMDNVYEVTSVNSWGDITWKNANNKVVNDDADTRLYFVMGTGNPTIKMYAEEIVTEGEKTGTYRALYDLYLPGMDMPQVGLYYKFTTKTDGQLKIQVWANKGNRNSYLINGQTKEAVKYQATGYINGQDLKDEEGNAIPNSAGGNQAKLFTAEEIQARHDAAKVQDGVDTAPYVIEAGNQPFSGWIIFDAKAGVDYWLFQDNSQIGFGGYEFTSSDPEGIQIVKGEQANAPIYNLAGQRVNGNAKGIMIQNGRKMIVK